MVDSTADARPTFYEFFAGGGMARAGLGEGWRCLFANDIDAHKAAAYRANWGEDDFRLGDIAALTAADLPGSPDLVWGSFPCQDLSLAGAGAGLDGRRSGTFHAFFGLIRDLDAQGRAPRLVAIENVCGALTSQGGRDFEAICRTFVAAGYRPGPLVINADRFLPQSRPRLFVVGVRDAGPPPARTTTPGGPFHPPNLRRAVESLPGDLRAQVIWWRLPEPTSAPAQLADLIEADPADAAWRGVDWTRRLLGMMSPVNRAKVEAARRTGSRVVGAVFRRTRVENGRKVQRAEVRFDRAGCLRTPAGGSSRQILLVVEGDRVRARLMSGRETARLMGLPDNYRLPGSAGAVAHLTGDGVAVPVVRHLAEKLFGPLLSDTNEGLKAA
ncbi:MAG: DNA cytosine methyltransferase [Brevundimonas sp.]|nr:MAG: DNA cytosine methyltransferase [Brevundimonas sp.]